MECYYKRYVFIFYLFFTTIRIIVIKIVFHHGELVNVSQSEAIEASDFIISTYHGVLL